MASSGRGKGGRGGGDGRGGRGGGPGFGGFSGGGNWNSNENLVGYEDKLSFQSSGQDADAESSDSTLRRPNPNTTRPLGPFRPARSIRSSEASLGGQANSDQASTAGSTLGYESRPGTGAGTPYIGDQFRPYGGPQDYDSQGSLARGLEAERSDVAQSYSDPPSSEAPRLGTMAADIYRPPSSSQSISQSGSNLPAFGVPGLGTMAGTIPYPSDPSSKSISTTMSTVSTKRAASRPRPGTDRRTNSQEDITALPPPTGADEEPDDPKAKGDKGEGGKKKKGAGAGDSKGPFWDPRKGGGGAAGGQAWDPMRKGTGGWTGKQ